MSNSNLLQNPEKQISRDSCSYFFNELVKSPMLDKVKPVDYPYGNLDFALSGLYNSIYTYIHTINSDNSVDRFYAPIRIFNNNYGGLIIEIPDERIKLISGYFSFNSDFTFMKYNNFLHALEIDVNHNSIKTRVIIFSHFFTE